jgi:hypothetical protein
VTAAGPQPEPTDEQQAVAQKLVLGWGMDDGFPALVDRVARALAAAVTAERDKYLRVADELEQFATETRNQAPAESGLLRANTVGWAAASSAAARRIREVAK